MSQTHWGQQPEQSPPQPSVSHQHDAMRSHMQITEQHRSSLAQQIGVFRAQSDTCKAQAAAYPDRAEQLNDESARLAECAQMLERRLGQLLGDVHLGSQPPPAQEPKTERRPWQKEEWWRAFEQLRTGVNALGASLAGKEAIVGNLACVNVRAALVAAGKVVRPTNIKDATVDQLLELRGIADAIEPVPWHLIEADPQQGTTLVSLARWLASEMPKDPTDEDERREEIKSAFVALAEVYSDNPEVERLRSAQQAWLDGLGPRASAILSGLAPPDPLRYLVRRLALLTAR